MFVLASNKYYNVTTSLRLKFVCFSFSGWNYIGINLCLIDLELSGPTSFAPIIREAIKIVAQARSYHILVIICDGQVDVVKDTVAAIVEATNYPLSIIAVGVWRSILLIDCNV